MSIKLRPHHGMCFQFYEGKGYSADFTDHMGRVIRELEADPSQKIELSCLVDVVCANCPNNMAGKCETEDKVLRYDNAVLQKCNLTDGEEISYEDFIHSVKTQIIDAGFRQEICGDCGWNYICSKKE